jgi:hypothetical protein
MRKYLLLFPITIALAILFYPTTSNSNSTGSIGGKTGSPTDGSSCTQCHYAGQGSGATITTNIPANGYVPNQVYTITANIQGSDDQYGFEITAEEASLVAGSKTGTFFITNNSETKLTNNNEAVTHKLGGTQGGGMKSWNMDWEAPNTGAGAVTFWGAFIEGNMNGANSGDIYHSANLTVNEAVINAVSDLTAKNDFTFNTVNKVIETINTVLVYDINGKLVLTTNNKLTNISHLKNGIYILKSESKTQKIILN